MIKTSKQTQPDIVASVNNHEGGNTHNFRSKIETEIDFLPANPRRDDADGKQCPSLAYGSITTDIKDENYTLMETKSDYCLELETNSNESVVPIAKNNFPSLVYPSFSEDQESIIGQDNECLKKSRKVTLSSNILDCLYSNTSLNDHSLIPSEDTQNIEYVYPATCIYLFSK